MAQEETVPTPETEVEVPAKPETSSSTEEKPDYEAILREEREKREKAEKALAEQRFNASRQRREEGDDLIPSDDDKPLTRKDLAELLREEREATRKELQETTAIQIARELTGSEDEAQAALVYYKNRVRPTGDLRDDMIFAVAGLNHRKTVAKAAELTRALKSKTTASNDIASAHVDPEKPADPKLAALDQQAYARAGFKFEKGLWVKELPNKKKLYKDPKTKRQWTD